MDRYSYGQTLPQTFLGRLKLLKRRSLRSYFSSVQIVEFTSRKSVWGPKEPKFGEAMTTVLDLQVVQGEIMYRNDRNSCNS